VPRTIGSLTRKLGPKPLSSPIRWTTLYTAGIGPEKLLPIRRRSAVATLRLTISVRQYHDIGNRDPRRPRSLCLAGGKHGGYARSYPICRSCVPVSEGYHCISLVFGVILLLSSWHATSFVIFGPRTWSEFIDYYGSKLAMRQVAVN